MRGRGGPSDAPQRPCRGGQGRRHGGGRCETGGGRAAYRTVERGGRMTDVLRRRRGVILGGAGGLRRAADIQPGCAVTQQARQVDGAELAHPQLREQRQQRQARGQALRSGGAAASCHARILWSRCARPRLDPPALRVRGESWPATAMRPGGFLPSKRTRPRWFEDHRGLGEGARVAVCLIRRRRCGRTACSSRSRPCGSWRRRRTPDTSIRSSARPWEWCCRLRARASRWPGRCGRR